MSTPDFRGARGANAGDDFHELWALRQALKLLDQDSDLTAITVEGLRIVDESGVPPSTWDGVDCTFYYGGEEAETAERIIFDQVKYSAANPDKKWTVARLTNTTNKQKNNSIIGKFAKEFLGIKSKHPDLVTSTNLLIRLVSNQEIDPNVISALSKQTSHKSSHRQAVKKASKLNAQDFELFAKCLDFSECGKGSRFSLEEHILATISNWTDDDARATINNLMRYVRRAMMPESRGEWITRQSILLWMGFSDPGALFPCPSAITKIQQLIPRKESKTIVEKLKSGYKYICLHGEGGCGKTTALQEIESLLPKNSVVVTFDCYGGGRYLDSDAFRHRPQEAFLQLSNDLARQLRIPLLVSRATDLNYPRILKKRLEKAADVVTSIAEDALLVIVIDAADNSIIAANTQSPPERSFVHDFMAVGALPENVCFIVTARTGRLQSLNIPRKFTKIKLAGFSQEETSSHVHSYWKNAPVTWLRDFHYLSGGNPRVQKYALDYAGTEIEQALNYLRPSGKDINQVFDELLEHTRQKIGYDHDIASFSAGLIALPRPIPLAHLSAVTNLEEAHVRDLCSDLAPGIRIVEGKVGFADEDFENFLRDEAENHLNTIHSRIAHHFLNRQKEDAYAATHVAGALLNAGQKQELIDLIKTKQNLDVIGDPVLRREVYLRRFRIAMKVCREMGNNVDALLTLLIGAEALKTNDVIENMLIDNPDLAANFAQDTSSRLILRDSEKIENHGPLLFHLMAVDASREDDISVREGHRQLQAWLKRRKEAFKEQKKEHPDHPTHGWDISSHDIAAETEAILRIENPQRALEVLRHWRPKSTALEVTSILCSKLITSRESSLVERCLIEADISQPWDLFLVVPLALSGLDVDLPRIETSLKKLLRRNLIRLDRVKNSWNDSNFDAQFIETIVTACEVFIAFGGKPENIIPVLDLLADQEYRRRDNFFTSQVQLIDVSLRAYTILERIKGRRTTFDSYLIDPPDPSEDLSPEEVKEWERKDKEKRGELRDFIEPIIDVYNIRAQVLLEPKEKKGFKKNLEKVLSHYQGQKYKMRHDVSAMDMRIRVSLSLIRLMMLKGLNKRFLMKAAITLFDKNSYRFNSTLTKILTNLAADQALHQHILDAVIDQSELVKRMKISSEDKITALLDFARLLLPISYADSESIFNEAIEIASEVNADAIHEIALFAPLTERAQESLNILKRKEMARNLAIVASDTSIRLAGYDGFPWKKTGQALTTLDINVALAATSRWEDLDIVDLATLLPVVLETSLSNNSLTPQQVASLSALLDYFSIELVDLIVRWSSKQNGNSRKKLGEHLAREEVLRFGKGTRQEVNEKLQSLSDSGDLGFWTGQLKLLTAFQNKEDSRQASLSDDLDQFSNNKRNEVKQVDSFAEVNWEEHRFTSIEDINDVISQIKKASQTSSAYVSTEMILTRIGESVALKDRVAHLKALSQLDSPQVPGYELGQIIAKQIEEWQASPSVRRWGDKELIKIVVKYLPGFSRWLHFGRSPLPSLIEKCNISDDRIFDALLEGIERHVDSLNAATIYSLVGLISQHCSPDDVGKVLDHYSSRLVERIPHPDRDQWDLNDIPKDATSSLARFLYALVGDIDSRIRWRATHAVRNLAQLEDNDTVNVLINLYEKRNELSYRNPDAPFHWLNARLWLMIAMDRIASESPNILENCAERLLEIACDNEFPHILLRSFAKSTVIKLEESRVIQISPTQLKALDSVNTSPKHRRKSAHSYGDGFKRQYNEGKNARRFHFNTMDTLPYWYSGARRVFAEVDAEGFLDVAESWIVDKWGVQDNPWEWAKQPRLYRLNKTRYAGIDNRHGSLPTVERYNTYLEWHAMFCTVGELLNTCALAEVDEDDYDVFESWLSRVELTSPPLWLADLHKMKPLETRFWFSPHDDIDEWVEDISNDDFLIELGLINGNNTIVVNSHHETRSSDFSLSARVTTALVSPDTAPALVRALQTVNDPWDYRIPPAGDSLEIDSPPYKLLGWLDDTEPMMGLDEHDPFRYEVRAIEYGPSINTVKAMNLAYNAGDQIQWIEKGNKKPVFNYEAWGDNRGDENEENFRYDKTTRSSGYRLRVDKKALQSFLIEMQFDLIVGIEITRKNKGYEYYSRYDKETIKKSVFDRVILLQRDGTIKAAEGRLGTWAVSRS